MRPLITNHKNDVFHYAHTFTESMDQDLIIKLSL